MICAEMPLAAAKDGLFPERFGAPVRAGVPAFGIVASTLLAASVAVVISYLGRQRCHGLHHAGADDRDHRGDPVRVLGARPDQVAAARTDATRRTPRVVRDVTVAVVALVFSVLFIWYSRNTGEAWYVVWGPFLMAGGAFVLGIPVYLAQRCQDDRPHHRCQRTRPERRQERRRMSFHVDSEVGQPPAGDRAPTRAWS